MDGPNGAWLRCPSRRCPGPSPSGATPAEAALFPLLNTVQVLDLFYDLPNEGDVLARALEGWAKEHGGGEAPPAVAHAAMVSAQAARPRVARGP